jgi:hypothetical protein
MRTAATSERLDACCTIVTDSNSGQADHRHKGRYAGAPTASIGGLPLAVIERHLTALIRVIHHLG